MNRTTKHRKCNFTQTTGADQCDLYIHPTDEEEQTAAEESVVGDVATVVVKNEYSSDFTSSADNLELIHEDDNHIDYSNNDCESDLCIKLEARPLDEATSEDLHNKTAASCAAFIEHTINTQDLIKSESIIFGCTLCYEDFVQEDAYNEHMITHLQDAGGDATCDASQVCEPRAAVSRSCDSLVLQNNTSWRALANSHSAAMFHRTGSQRLNDAPPPAAGCAQATVAPLSARLAANDYKVQATEEAAATWKSEQILETDIGELDNQLSQSNTNTLCMYDINRFTNCVVQLCDIFKKPKKTVLDENPHVKTHTGAMTYSCETCNYKCARKSVLNSHKRTHTGEKPYACYICNYKCAHKSTLINHKKTHTGEKPYSCETLNYKTAHKSTLLMHKKTHTSENPYSCNVCNYKTAFNNNLLLHKRTHTGEKPYSCEICSYKTADKSNLSRHTRTHTAEKPYSCETCNYKCTRKGYLNWHERTHTGQKLYSCDICNYKTVDKGNLIRHIKTHSGEKPFCCETCSYKTAYKYHFLVHKKTHTGEKPYSCEICNYKSAEIGNLLRHKRTHTGEKPFSCDLCSYKTAEKSKLLRHNSTHTGKKLFSCNVCNYKTAKKINLSRHTRTHTCQKP
ncbi:gastrula zinc finger protein XlCGF57.1-like [Bicyclus anynana]|uniref:Gastrula zinc finger protein XlCGF57.1-like n=1 Tax=Bicyclus anynana TaxID=110368 RepID=A0ABM3M3J5_BICAN|nr:gastrula zinc finger protein XlCGF57.1-like [Bicyclus anynana]XP_052746058.1 gastrula zinc finger protein XlCGF57.1-like [Bicyclus anynana]